MNDKTQAVFILQSRHAMMIAYFRLGLSSGMLDWPNYSSVGLNDNPIYY